MKKNVVIMLAAVVLLTLALYEAVQYVTYTVAANRDEAPKINHPAPSFELAGLDEELYRVGGERDKPLWINFWASWCVPCLEEAPYMQKLYEEYGEQLDLYAVNATRYDRPGGAEYFVDQFGLTFPILMDRESEAMELYNILAYPTSILVDRQGIIREVFYAASFEEMERRIKRLIR